MKHSHADLIASETRAEYLERNIAEVQADLERMFWKTSAASVNIEELELKKQLHSMKAELNEIRPYKIEPNHPWNPPAYYLISHKGNYVTDEDGQWIKFPSIASANFWITDTLGLAIAAE